MRICLIGNSHVAAVRNGWAALVAADRRPSEIDITFYASTRDRMANLIVTDGALISPPDMPGLQRHLVMTSGGSTSIRPDDFDLFVIHGLLFRVPQIDQRWSAAVRRAVCVDSYTQSANAVVLAKLQSLTDKPIIITPVPLRSKARRGDLTDGFLPYATTCHLIDDSIGCSQVSFFGQPLETTAHPWVTRQEFATGAKALESNAAVAATDDVHMNDDFGQKYLEDLFARVSRRTTSQTIDR